MLRQSYLATLIVTVQYERQQYQWFHDALRDLYSRYRRSIRATFDAYAVDGMEGTFCEVVVVQSRDMYQPYRTLAAIELLPGVVGTNAVEINGCPSMPRQPKTHITMIDKVAGW